MRAKLSVDARRKISVEIYAAYAHVDQLSRQCQQAIERLSNLSELIHAWHPLAIDDVTVRQLPEFALKISHKDAVDLEAERSRLLREKQKLEREIASLLGQLANEQFLSKAPKRVVENMQQRNKEVNAQYEKVRDSLERLG